MLVLLHMLIVQHVICRGTGQQKRTHLPVNVLVVVMWSMVGSSQTWVVML